jgi:hypothetical protein
MSHTTINYTKSMLGIIFNGFYYSLPKSEGETIIMVVLDSITKYVHFVSLYHPFKESTIATKFMEIVQKLHGVPKIVVSDRDPIFTRKFWNELFSCLGTQLGHKSYYHSQPDGKTKIVNKFLEGYICFFSYDKQTQWVRWFPLEKWWYKKSILTLLKISPFMALYGFHPPSIISPLNWTTNFQSVEDHIGHQQEVLKILKDNLVMIENSMKQKEDKHYS